MYLIARRDCWKNKTSHKSCVFCSREVFEPPTYYFSSNNHCHRIWTTGWKKSKKYQNNNYHDVSKNFIRIRPLLDFPIVGQVVNLTGYNKACCNIYHFYHKKSQVPIYTGETDIMQDIVSFGSPLLRNSLEGDLHELCANEFRRFKWYGKANGCT